MNALGYSSSALGRLKECLTHITYHEFDEIMYNKVA
jgi:hypothetical protein